MPILQVREAPAFGAASAPTDPVAAQTRVAAVRVAAAAVRTTAPDPGEKQNTTSGTEQPQGRLARLRAAARRAAEGTAASDNSSADTGAREHAVFVFEVAERRGGGALRGGPPLLSEALARARTADADADGDADGADDDGGAEVREAAVAGAPTSFLVEHRFSYLADLADRVAATVAQAPPLVPPGDGIDGKAHPVVKRQVPPFPPKTVPFLKKKNSPEVIKDRCESLSKWLSQVLSMHEFLMDKELVNALLTPSGGVPSASAPDRIIVGEVTAFERAAAMASASEEGAAAAAASADAGKEEEEEDDDDVDKPKGTPREDMAAMLRASGWRVRRVHVVEEELHAAAVAASTAATAGAGMAAENMPKAAVAAKPPSAATSAAASGASAVTGLFKKATGRGDAAPAEKTSEGAVSESSDDVAGAVSVSCAADAASPAGEHLARAKLCQLTSSEARKGAAEGALEMLSRAGLAPLRAAHTLHSLAHVIDDEDGLTAAQATSYPAALIAAGAVPRLCAALARTSNASAKKGTPVFRATRGALAALIMSTLARLAHSDATLDETDGASEVANSVAAEIMADDGAMSVLAELLCDRSWIKNKRVTALQVEAARVVAALAAGSESRSALLMKLQPAQDEDDDDDAAADGEGGVQEKAKQKPRPISLCAALVALLPAHGAGQAAGAGAIAALADPALPGAAGRAASVGASADAVPGLVLAVRGGSHEAHARGAHALAVLGAHAPGLAGQQMELLSNVGAPPAGAPLPDVETPVALYARSDGATEQLKALLQQLGPRAKAAADAQLDPRAMGRAATARGAQIGDTPAHAAARAGLLDPVSLLSQHGADLRMTNAAGKSAADVAAGADIKDGIDALISAAELAAAKTDDKKGDE